LATRKRKRSRLDLIFGGAGARFGKTLLTVVAISVPTAAVWAASSLAAYWNGPIWLAVLSGVLLFPGLPLAWEGLSVLWRRRREAPPKRILEVYDRLILRTLVLNVVFLTAFLVLFPKPVFAALTTRGDWMLEGIEGAKPIADSLLGTADKLSWLWDLAHENPYDDFDEDDDIVPDGVGTDTATDTDGDDTDTDTDSDTDTPIATNTWPFPSSLHPLVANFPSAQEGSIESVGHYLAANEENTFLLAKAVHDFAANRVAYDAPALAVGDYPPQDAETVFRERIGVCAGYARLVRAIGLVAGLEIVYVVGDARVGENPDPAGDGHAWNAIRIEGSWYLMDATWAAGSVAGTTFTKRYESETFLAPPEVFGIRHFPDEPRWQLRDQPLTRGQFNRQPMMGARFFAHGFRLRSPNRSQVDTTSDFTARITSDGSNWLMVKAQPRNGLPEVDCGIRRGRDLEFRCPLTRSGTYTISFYDSPIRYDSSYRGVGSIVVNRR
jgi:transglutaminase-like putative cysteine protease